jgi:UDP-glucose 4-epimerase
MKALVTGGAGFIGTNLIKKLLNEGYEVVSIDNYKSGFEHNHISGCHYFNMDIRDAHDYTWLGVDIVFHLAAIARIQPSFHEPKDYFTTNVNGSLNLIHWCAQNNVPLVYAGSSSKYSGRFKNPYTFSKDVGEDIVTLYQQHYNLKASITRFYNVYGPYQLEEGGYSTVIGIWQKAFREGKPILVTGDGEQRRDFTHVHDIVDALYRIGEKNAWGYEFELGRGINYSLNELVEFMGVSPKYIPQRPGEARDTLNTDTLAKEILDWVPKINIESYIKNEFNNQKTKNRGNDSLL